jgi:hypothetical protein
MVPLLLRWSAAATVFVIQAECGSEGSLLCDRGCNWRMRMCVCVCVEAPSLAATAAAAVAPEVKRPAQYVLISGLRGSQPGLGELQDCTCQWVLTGRLGSCCQLTHLGGTGRCRGTTRQACSEYYARRTLWARTSTNNGSTCVQDALLLSFLA